MARNIDRMFYGGERPWHGLGKMSAAFSMALLAGACAAADGRVAVEVQSTASDPVGIRLTYQVREHLARSATFRAREPSDKMFMVMSLVTIDSEQEAERRGLSGTYSHAVLWAISPNGLRWHLSNSVGVCGAGRVASCAEDLIAVMADRYERDIKPK